MRELVKRLHPMKPRAIAFIHHEIADVAGRWRPLNGKFVNERLVFIGRHVAIQSFKDHVPVFSGISGIEADGEQTQHEAHERFGHDAVRANFALSDFLENLAGNHGC